MVTRALKPAKFVRRTALEPFRNGGGCGVEMVPMKAGARSSGFLWEQAERSARTRQDSPRAEIRNPKALVDHQMRPAAPERQRGENKFEQMEICENLFLSIGFKDLLCRLFHRVNQLRRAEDSGASTPA